MTYDCLIVGAGWAGCVLAERLANALGQKVLLVERREQIGGNACDSVNKHGIVVQEYGPHIFHTRTKAVWEYVGRFTDWNGYVHRVLAQVGDKTVYLPINLDTMERLYDRPFTAEQLREYFAERRVPVEPIANARDVVVSQVGWELYELFYENYTKKQWGLYPHELAPQCTRSQLAAHPPLLDATPTHTGKPVPSPGPPDHHRTAAPSTLSPAPSLRRIMQWCARFQQDR